MKALKTAFAIVIVAVLYSCGKSGLAPAPTVIGKWTLVSDSTSGGHKYTGTSSDYYNFAANGTLYINNKGRTGLDTATYQIVTSTQINIYYTVNGFNEPYAGNGTFSVTTFTDHALVMSSIGLTSQGLVTTYLSLKR